MLVPLAKPKVELMPFFINWKGSVHPTSSLANKCQLVELKMQHPRAEEIMKIFKALGIKQEVVKSDEVSMEAVLETKRGVLRI